MFKSILFILICLLLFVSGLQIPRISGLITIFLPMLAILDNLIGTKLFLLKKNILGQTKFIQSLLILTLFCIIYWTMMNSHGFLTEEISWLFYVGVIIRIISYYIIGFSINYSWLPLYPYNTIIVMSSLIGSTVIHSALSIQKTLQSNPALIESRHYLEYWSGREWPATGAGDFFCLGLLYVVVVFYGYQKDYKLFYLFFMLVSASFVILSLNGTVLLQNRLALITTVIGVIIISILLEFKSKFKLITIPFFAGLLATVSIGVNLAEFALSILLPRLGALNPRILSRGIESGRFDNYQVAIQEIWNYPFGGRQFNLPVSQWVHNLWLDVAYDAGILPMFLLLLYFAIHLKYFLNIFNSQLPKIIIVYFSTISIGILFNASLGPIIQGSNFEFGMFCFFLGMMARLSGEIKISQKQYWLESYHARTTHLN